MSSSQNLHVVSCRERTIHDWEPRSNRNWKATPSSLQAVKLIGVSVHRDVATPPRTQEVTLTNTPSLDPDELPGRCLHAHAELDLIRLGTRSGNPNPPMLRH